MAITAAGVGSGLDIESIVTQLMSIERQPLTALQKKESDYKAQLSAFGRLKGALSSFQDAMKELSTLDKFRVYSSTSSDENVLTATADSTAAAGSYSVQIDRLAQNHKEGSAEFADTDTFGGSAGDSLDLTVGTSTLSVDLSTAQTLSQIRDTINSDANNPGVTATILNTGTGTQRLILTADESGYDNRVQLSYGGTLTSTTFNFGTLNTDSSAATLTDLTQLDASYSIDGIALTSATNAVTGVMDGITLDLKQTGSADLTLSRDTDKITESTQAFVDAYNNLQNTIKDLRAGNLSGDSTLTSIQSQLRNEINTEPSGLSSSYTTLYSVGISTDAKTGELLFDSADFETALNTDFSGVTDLFANDAQGYAFRFQDMADTLLKSDGLIDTRQDGLNTRISDVQDREVDMQYRLDLKEKALRSQYAALDGLVGRLNSTSQFLAAQLRY
jgi:flagellar hook-associated protein 2